MLEHINQSTQHLLWDILVKSDLLNVIILAIAFVYLGNKYLPKIIDKRKEQLTKEIGDAKSARIKTEEELEKVKQKTQNLENEIEEIKEEAKKTALLIQKQIEEETQKDLDLLELKMKKEIDTSWEEVLQDIKKSVGDTAIKLAHDTLNKVSKNEAVQKKLIDDFLVELKGPNKN